MLPVLLDSTISSELPLTKTEFDDDDNFLFSDKKVYTMINMDTKNFNFRKIERDHDTNFLLLSEAFIYSDTVVINYQRTFMKLQDVINNLNSNVTILLLIFKFVGSKYDYFALTKKVISRTLLLKSPKFNKFKENFGICSKDFNSTNKTVERVDLKKQERTTKMIILKSFEAKNQKEIIDFHNYFCISLIKLCCYSRLDLKYKKNLALIEMGYEHFVKVTDVLRIINSLTQIELLKYQILKPHQVNLLNNTRKKIDINYFNWSYYSTGESLKDEEVQNYLLYSNESDEKKFELSLNHYRNKILKNELDRIDVILIDKIPNEKLGKICKNSFVII
jgi:hypothetical protein